MNPVLYFSESVFKAIMYVAMTGLGFACILLIVMFIKEKSSNTLW